MVRKIKLMGNQELWCALNRITFHAFTDEMSACLHCECECGCVSGGRGGERRLYLKAEIKYGERQVVSKVGSILREEEEVVMEGEEHEVKESQEV